MTSSYSRILAKRITKKTFCPESLSHKAFLSNMGEYGQNHVNFVSIGQLVVAAYLCAPYYCIKAHVEYVFTNNYALIVCWPFLASIRNQSKQPHTLGSRVRSVESTRLEVLIKLRSHKLHTICLPVGMGPFTRLLSPADQKGTLLWWTYSAVSHYYRAIQSH